MSRRKRKLNHTVTHEISAVFTLADLAEVMLDDRYSASAPVELHVRHVQSGQKFKFATNEGTFELLAVQFVREQRDPIEPAPPPATEQTT